MFDVLRGELGGSVFDLAIHCGKFRVVPDKHTGEFLCFRVRRGARADLEAQTLR